MSVPAIIDSPWAARHGLVVGQVLLAWGVNDHNNGQDGEDVIHSLTGQPRPSGVHYVSTHI